MSDNHASGNKVILTTTLLMPNNHITENMVMVTTNMMWGATSLGIK